MVIQKTKKKNGEEDIVLCLTAVLPKNVRLLLPPHEMIRPELQAIADSIEDSLFVVLSPTCFPMLLNELGFSLLAALAPAHSLGPSGYTPHDHDQEGAHCTTSPWPVSKIYASNWINTWVPEEAKEHTWREYNILQRKDTPFPHVFDAIMQTQHGVMRGVVTDFTLFHPVTQIPICSVHIWGKEVDERVSVLLEDLTEIVNSSI